MRRQSPLLHVSSFVETKMHGFGRWHDLAPLTLARWWRDRCQCCCPCSCCWCCQFHGLPGSASPAPLQTAEAGLTLLWPTPIFRSRTPATAAAAAQLRRAVPLLRAVDPGVQKSNKKSGGWHSSVLIGEGATQLHALVGESGASVTMGAIVALEEVVRGAAHAMLTRMDAARFGAAVAT